jgi:hypothetical protein
MHFAFRKTGVSLVGVSVILCCSCEKHHLGEMPEVQKEHVETAGASEENPEATKKSAASPAPSVKPTPAEFFPESTPR